MRVSYSLIYENHFDSRRNTEDSSVFLTNEEFVINIYGPNFPNSDSVIKEAMDDYWNGKGGEWHFFRKSVIEKVKKYKGDCESLNSLLTAPSKIPLIS